MKRFALPTALAVISLSTGGCGEDKQPEAARPITAPEAAPMPTEEAPPEEPKFEPDFSLLLSSPDRKQLLIGLKHSPWLELWDVAMGERVWGRKVSNAAFSADFSHNGRWIVFGEALGSSDSDVILLDRYTGAALQTFTGAGDYADVEFKSNSLIKANSVRWTDGEEEIIELTWRIKGEKPTIRNSSAERWPPTPGEFPITAGNFTLTRGEDRNSVYVKSGRKERLLCKSDRPYRLGLSFGATWRSLRMLVRCSYFVCPTANKSRGLTARKQTTMLCRGNICSRMDRAVR